MCNNNNNFKYYIQGRKRYISIFRTRLFENYIPLPLQFRVFIAVTTENGYADRNKNQDRDEVYQLINNITDIESNIQRLQDVI